MCFRCHITLPTLESFKLNGWCITVSRFSSPAIKPEKLFKTFGFTCVKIKRKKPRLWEQLNEVVMCCVAAYNNGSIPNGIT